MEYLFVSGLQLFGIAFHVGQKILDLDKQNPTKSIGEITALFFENEWSSLLVSGLILFFHLFVHMIINYHNMAIISTEFSFPYTTTKVPLYVLSYCLAFVFGYAGQRLAYKYLGKAETYLSNKAD